MEATFVVFPEQEIQKSNPSVSAASGHEDREYHDKANEMIVSTNRPTTGDEENQNKPRKIEDSVSPNAQLQNFPIKESEEFRQLSAKEPNSLSQFLTHFRPLTKMLNQMLNAYLYTIVTLRFERIERREAKNDPKPLFVKSDFQVSWGNRCRVTAVKIIQYQALQVQPLHVPTELWSDERCC